MYFPESGVPVMGKRCSARGIILRMTVVCTEYGSPNLWDSSQNIAPQRLLYGGRISYFLWPFFFLKFLLRTHTLLYDTRVTASLTMEISSSEYPNSAILPIAYSHDSISEWGQITSASSISPEIRRSYIHVRAIMVFPVPASAKIPREPHSYILWSMRS